MKEIEYVPRKDGLNFSEILKKVIIAIVVIAIIIILIATGQIVFILQAFGWIENRVREITGLDVLLVKGITAILMAILLIIPVGKLIFSFFPLPQKNKKIKRFAVFAVFALLFFASYLSSSKVFFSPTTGEPLKYYSIAPNGEYKFYSSGGYDPITGDKLQSINKEIVTNYLNNLNGTVTDIGNSVETNSTRKDQTPSLGANKYAKSYPVKFINKTGKSIFICISSDGNPSGTISTNFIPANKQITLNLTEGRNLFGYIDIDGNWYGNRDWGNILVNAEEYVGQRISLKVPFKENYVWVASFYLEVLPTSNQIITLKTDYPRHNKELGPKETEKREEKIIICFVLIIFFAFAFWIIRFSYTILIPKKKKNFNDEKN